MTQPLPLAGLKVIELGHSVAAPYAALVLAELGAEVVKVEKPAGGDDARKWGPPFVEGAAPIFHALNRNKRSIAVDLRDAGQLARLRKMVLEADVLIQNLRPGQAEAMGLGAAALLAENPRLIHASIGAFGASGPLKEEPGYDPLMQAFGGLMSVTGEPGRPPVRFGSSPIDMGSGMWVVIGVLSALLNRGITGRGGEVVTSLYETSLAWMFYHLAQQQVSGEEPGRHGSGAATIVPYQAFTCSDGDLVVAAGNDGLYRKVCTAIGQPELADDPRYVTNGERVKNRASLIGTLQRAFAGKTREQWMALLKPLGVPCAPVQNVAEIAAHPQTLALGILRGQAPGLVPSFGLPLSFDGARPDRDGPAPRLGEGNAELFAE